MTVVTIACEGVSAAKKLAARRRRRIDAFHPSYRTAIAELTRCASAIEDLADSFPALLFALASGYGTPAARDRAAALVIAGAPLRTASDALGLPWWSRKLPAQALTAPLPALPADCDFGLRIAGLVPSDDRTVGLWLTRVAHAIEACNARYALWLARHTDAIASADEFFMLLAAWAWFSENPGHLGHQLVRKPWHPEISFRRAREELAIWRQRLRLIESLGFGIERPWLTDGSAGGHDFIALRTANDFIAESQALDNCLDQYADQLRTGATAVFSIRKNGRSVACVEIGLHETEVTMPTIVQLRGARNRRATPEVWQATFAWLGNQRLEPLAPERHTPSARKRSDARRRLWAPYLAFLAGTRDAQAFRRLVLGPTPTRSMPLGRRRVLTPRIAHLDHMDPASRSVRRPA